MNRLAERILKIYPDADLMQTITIQDDMDGRGAYIKRWSDIRPQPTQVQLLAIVLP